MTEVNEIFMSEIFSICQQAMTLSSEYDSFNPSYESPISSSTHQSIDQFESEYRAYINYSNDLFNIHSNPSSPLQSTQGQIFSIPTPLQIYKRSKHTSISLINESKPVENSPKEKQKRKIIRFSKAEDMALVKGVDEHGLDWIKIAYNFVNKDPVSLKNRYYYLARTNKVNFADEE